MTPPADYLLVVGLASILNEHLIAKFGWVCFAFGVAKGRWSRRFLEPALAVHALRSLWQHWAGLANPAAP